MCSLAWTLAPATDARLHTGGSFQVSCPCCKVTGQRFPYSLPSKRLQRSGIVRGCAFEACAQVIQLQTLRPQDKAAHLASSKRLVSGLQGRCQRRCQLQELRSSARGPQEELEQVQPDVRVRGCQRPCAQACLPMRSRSGSNNDQDRWRMTSEWGITHNGPCVQAHTHGMNALLSPEALLCGVPASRR